MTAAYLDQLQAAAGAAERAEAEFRQYAERRLEIMTAERVRAHRRYHLINDMVESARPIAEKPPLYRRADRIRTHPSRLVGRRRRLRRGV